jgi:hypothetical protein
MIYTYCKNQLIHRKVNLFKTSIILASIIGVSSVASYYIGIHSGFKKLTPVEKSIIIKRSDEFSKEKLVQMLKDLNVKQPHIVMAQSMTETGHWKSSIFLENNNLFGMKESSRRITTAEGTNRNHAYYNHWRESVYDYAFYQCRYVSSVRNEAEYFQYLGASYAEDPNYVKTLKEMIRKYKVKELFK